MRHKEAMEWPLALASVVLNMKGQDSELGPRIDGPCRRRCPGGRPRPKRRWSRKTISEEVAQAAGNAAVANAKSLGDNGLQDPDRSRGSQARDPGRGLSGSLLKGGDK